MGWGWGIHRWWGVRPSITRSGRRGRGVEAYGREGSGNCPYSLVAEIDLLESLAIEQRELEGIKQRVRTLTHGVVASIGEGSDKRPMSCIERDMYQ